MVVADIEEAAIHSEQALVAEAEDVGNRSALHIVKTKTVELFSYKKSAVFVFQKKKIAEKGFVCYDERKKCNTKTGGMSYGTSVIYQLLYS